MADKKLNELPSASLPLEGDEFLLVDQDGLSKKIQIDDLQIQPSEPIEPLVIPTPKLRLSGPTRIESVELTWSSLSKEFLNYNPKFYLFRYKAENKSWNDLGFKTRKSRGYRHPTHLGGTPGSKWFGGAPEIERETEWSLGQENEWIDINFYIFEWIKLETLLVDPRKRVNFARVRGGSRSAHRAYFKFCIGLEKPNPTPEEFPIFFGPMSETLAVIGNRGYKDDGQPLPPIDEYNKFSLKIL
jgi:hypothetical protein